MVDDLKAYAETRYTEEEFEQKRRQYAHAQPFTKESLLYREIFETFYPGQSEMICRLLDAEPGMGGLQRGRPSARVLANYGASGV